LRQQQAIGIAVFDKSVRPAVIVGITLAVFSNFAAVTCYLITPQPYLNQQVQA
jgi:hypothetical protein